MIFTLSAILNAIEIDNQIGFGVLRTVIASLIVEACKAGNWFSHLERSPVMGGLRPNSFS